jgi:hypothetical protein
MFAYSGMEWASKRNMYKPIPFFMSSGYGMFIA